MSLQVQSQVKDPERIRERRDQIIRAAVCLFTEKGFHKTTTREIAKASGLSNGALYEYVTCKEDILFLTCQHIHQEIERQWQAEVPVMATGRERLRHAISSLFTVMYAMQADVLLIYQEAKSLPKPYLVEVLKREQSLVDQFANHLHLGVKDGSLSVSAESIPLLSQNMVVIGQMWAFRRWSLRDMKFDDFAQQQLRMLMLACGVTE